MKKLLLLGGLRYLLPVIKTAKELGIYVITCDYLPDNFAHSHSDEYQNISILDKEAVLSLAKDLNIDGIMSFAVDPGVLTASYVAEKMGLPGCPYKSVQILQNKSLFREFLADNGFNVPKAKGFTTFEEALKQIHIFNFPVIVKPVDAAGSKGVTKVDSLAKLSYAIEFALKNSMGNESFIIEEFIQQKGFSSDTDSFSIESDLQFVSFSNQYFNGNAANPYTPAAYSWPSNIISSDQDYLVSELKRLVKLLNLGTSIFNIEVRVGIDNKPYIMEVSPRGGGNRLAEMVNYSTGTDLIRHSVRAAIGENVEPLEMPKYNGYWAEVILHSERQGKFNSLQIDESILKNNLIEEDLWVQPGSLVNSFNAANDAIGTLVLRFNSAEEMHDRMSSQNNWLKVIVD
jgi:biotin carboxylase